MIEISSLYCCFHWNNEESNIFTVFDWQNSKEEYFKRFKGKLMQKPEEKALNKSWKKWTAR